MRDIFIFLCGIMEEIPVWKNAEINPETSHMSGKCFYHCSLSHPENDRDVSAYSRQRRLSSRVCVFSRV